MKDERIIEEMAKLDGVRLHGWIPTYNDPCNEAMAPEAEPVPHYLTDHNAVQRVIDGLGEVEASLYGKVLHEVLSAKLGRPANVADFVWAECPSRCEAILKAKGVWE